MVQNTTSFHRHVVNPGDDITNECECVQAIAPVLHTSVKIVEAYQATVTEYDLQLNYYGN